MKKLLLFSSLFFSLTVEQNCKNENNDNKLFLDFKSGISFEEYQKIANQNLDLTINKEATSEYYYNLSLKTSMVKTIIHPCFNTKSGALYKILLHGETKNNAELLEIEKMFTEKLKTPTVTQEHTTIKMSESTCFNWIDDKKNIRFCKDSFVDGSYLSMENLLKSSNKKIGFSKAPLIYAFEISFLDKKNAE